MGSLDRQPVGAWRAQVCSVKVARPATPRHPTPRSCRRRIAPRSSHRPRWGRARRVGLQAQGGLRPLGRRPPRGPGRHERLRPCHDALPKGCGAGSDRAASAPGRPRLAPGATGKGRLFEADEELWTSPQGRVARLNGLNIKGRLSWATPSLQVDASSRASKRRDAVGMIVAPGASLGRAGSASLVTACSTPLPKPSGGANAPIRPCDPLSSARRPAPIGRSPPRASKPHPTSPSPTGAVRGAWGERRAWQDFRLH